MKGICIESAALSLNYTNTYVLEFGKGGEKVPLKFSNGSVYTCDGEKQVSWALGSDHVCVLTDASVKYVLNKEAECSVKDAGVVTVLRLSGGANLSYKIPSIYSMVLVCLILAFFGFNI